ncbi:MAG TPA: hypothetical protein VLE91_04780 [Candidatus Saccharimonadales bacterium]|nr:hypothetical protein [Candidatus Saccharimonadales bacterium]
MPIKVRFLLSFFLLFIIFQLVFITNNQFAVAKADELVLKDTGEIILIMPDSSVLAASTSGSDSKPTGTNQPKPASPSQQQPPAPSAPAPKTKSESLTPQNSKATININPQPTTDNKIKVTVTPQNKPTPPSTPQQQSKTPASNVTSPAQVSTGTTSPNPQQQQSSQTSPSASAEQPKVESSPPPPPISKLVDRVSEQAADGSTILSVQPGDNKITFQQGQTEVSTTLPIQIDSQTHLLSTISSNGPEKISILPNEAVAGATNLGIISKQQNTAPKVTLTEVDNQIVYKIEGQRTGKLLGIININSNVEVDISAQNGKAVSTSQSLLIRAFGFLIK